MEVFATRGGVYDFIEWLVKATGVDQQEEDKFSETFFLRDSTAEA